MTIRLDQPRRFDLVGNRVGRAVFTLDRLFVAREHYGRPDFEPIVRANAHQIDDPDLIFPGQVLRVPIGTG